MSQELVSIEVNKLRLIKNREIISVQMHPSIQVMVKVGGYSNIIVAYSLNRKKSNKVHDEIYNRKRPKQR